MTSNGAVSGTNGTFSGALFGANFTTSGAAIVSTLTSNGAVSGTSGAFTSLQVSGITTTNSLISNVYGVFGQNVTVNSTNTSTSTTTGALVVGGGIGLAGNIYAGGNVVAASFQPTSASVPGAGLYLPTTNTLALSTAGAERVRIDSTGKVGIGTITPGSTLDVNGIANFRSTLTTIDTTTAAALVSNTYVKTATVNATGAIVGANIVSNSTIQGVTVATVNSLVNNTTASFGGIVSINSTSNATSTGTGALQVAGGVGIIGNLYVGGNIVGAGTVTTFSGNSGVFYGDANGFGALYAGITGFTVVPNTVLQLAASINSYAQVNFENTNAGTQSTTDYVATANNGTDTTFYVDLGIAGSAYDNTSPNNSLGTALFPNDSYLYAQGNTSITNGGNLVVGTTTATKSIRFIAGGVNSANVALTITNTGLSVAPTTASTSTATGAVINAGGEGIAGNLNVGGTRNTFTNYVGVGTSTATGMSNVFSVYGSTNLYGNVRLLNSGGATSGIYFQDGSFQATSASSTPSFGLNGTVQFAGAGNTFSGNSTSFFWDTANNRLGIGTNTPGSLLDVNGIANFRSTVTVNGTATVNALVSNGAISGTTLNGTALTVTSSQNSGTETVQSLVSNTSVTGQQFQLNGNVATTSGITQITVDSFVTSAYRTAHYIIQVTDNSASSYHSAQIMLIHDGTTVYKTEYNEIYTAGLLGTFDASISGGVLTLLFTATSATNKTIKMLRQLVAV